VGSCRLRSGWRLPRVRKQIDEDERLTNWLPASSTDRPTLAARGCTCISNGKPAHGGVAMQPHQVRSVVRWPARAIGESAVARNTRPVRPGQLAIACPSRLRRRRSCQLERPVTLRAMRRRFGKRQFCGIAFARRARRATTPCCPVCPRALHGCRWLNPRVATYRCLGSMGRQLGNRQRARRARWRPASRAQEGE